jgi:hypothetical protein
MKKIAIMMIGTLAVAAFASKASANMYDEKYFTIDESSVKIELLETKGGTIPLNGGTTNQSIPKPGSLPTPPTGPMINPPGVNPGTGPSLNDTIGSIDKIVNLMDKIFNIIAKNKPVVNTNISYANAVPFGTSHWTQLQGWSKPSTKKYAFSMKNGFGSEVVKVVYQVHWTHSGNFAGKGMFLTGVTVEPISITAGWGYTVDLTAVVPDSTIANVGTSSDPIASMQVQLEWKVSTIVKIINEKAIYYIQGDGLMQEIASPFSKEVNEAKTAKQIEATEKLLGSTTVNW